MPLLFIFVSILGGVFSSGGGGGGGSQNQSPPAVQNNQNQPINSHPWISDYDLQDLNNFKNIGEYNNQWGLSSIKAAEAYATLKYNNKPVGGDGVIVGITDSGINFANQDLSGKGDNLLHYDVGNASLGNIITNPHGTHVAGIVGAVRNGSNSGMHGVAFNSKLLSVNVFNNTYIYNGYTETDSRYSLNYAASQNAKVINASWGYGGISTPSLAEINLMNQYMNEVVSKDSIVVFATGNNSYSDPTSPAIYANKGSSIDHMVAVASIDQNQQISSFSNLCGSVSNYCIAAPGGFDLNNYSIYSTYGNSYAYLPGTSMAAPHVSGAIAVIRAAWPNLTAQQTLDIIFSSADKKDVNGNNFDPSKYGQGILNLYEAVKARGEQTIISGSNFDSKKYLLTDTSLNYSSIFGDAFTKNVAPELTEGVFYDQYGRDYKAFLDHKFVSKNNQLSITDSNNLIFNNIENKTIPLSFGETKNKIFKVSFFDFKDQQARNRFGFRNFLIDKSQDPQIFNRNYGFAYTQNLSMISASSLKLGMSFNYDELSMMDAKEFGNSGFISQSNFSSNPYQSFFTNNSSLTNSSMNSNQINYQKFNQIFAKQEFFENKMALKFSYQSSYQKSQLSGDQISYFNFSNNGKKQNQALDFGITMKPNDSSNFMFSFGNLTEFDNNLLNSKSLGAFESKGNVKTSYFKINSKHYILDNLSFSVSSSEGVTKINGNQQGIFRSFENVRSRSSSISLNYEKFFNGTLGIGYSEPMRIYKGKVNYDIATGIDSQNNIIRKSGSASLAPIGKERNYEIFYKKDLNSISRLKINFVMQKDAFNIKSNQTQFLGYVNYAMKF